MVKLKRVDYREVTLQFQKTQRISRNELILPAEIIDEIDRHTISFSQLRDGLTAYGQHLRRGLLLYGPPGTGKSLTIMYLITSMPERTTILVNGDASEFIEDACTLARALQPATVVIDDVDLIAEDRGRYGASRVLFDLLQQMDGISDDADVLFVLTTNRPEALETALSERPGE